MSAENTQGRSVIWDALWVGFTGSDISTQLFGAGLDSDRLFVSGFADITGVEDANSHNIYLYLLISTGIVGVVLGLYLLSQVISIFMAVNNTDFVVIRLKILVSSLLFILLVAGITTDAIVRPQLMVLTCFFIGLLVQKFTLQKANFIDVKNDVK